jgi:adenylylsulfate kinase
MFKESKIRSIVKTISWRFLATATTFTLVYIFTGKLDVALSVGFLEVFLKMLIYFLHERVWDRLKFGRQEIVPKVLWFTGLAGSGKNQYAHFTYETLKEMGYKADKIDGHTVRHLFPETGYSRKEVNNHIGRVGYLASKLETNGVFVVASFLSPYAESREKVKELCQNYHEIYVDSSLEYCEKRDIDRLYSRFKKGEINNLPGKDAKYDVPIAPDIIISPEKESKEQIEKKIKQYLKKII